ncbi:MAG TPA: nucleotidyl transferase AbiEii/AbiGii toxin family protein [Terriglobales bacterium]|jgi:hypothetical protein|nr:nucleotidyl transferase AbiEii/AbiGii toxin family protein [Terriglobales bacterium]
MENIFSDRLIHSAECFSRDQLEKRRVKHGFAHLNKVEAFAWDLEIYGHLQQHLGDAVVLKGGAATQLYLPVELQRTSVDIDIICTAAIQEFDRVTEEILSRLSRDRKLLRFRKYVPTRPTPGLELSTYFVTTPSVCTPAENFGSQDPSIQQIKVDVLHDHIDNHKYLPKGTATFALDVAFEPGVFTADSLFGDKLLTLATTTVGIPDSRASDRCKQLYDLDKLLGQGLLTKSSEMQQAFDSTMECQRKIPGREQFTADEALADTIRFLGDATEMDVGNDPLGLWNALQGFQTNFVRQSARRTREGWAIGMEQLRFVAQSLRAQKSGGKEDPLTIYKNAVALETQLSGEGADNKGEIIRASQAKLLEFARSQDATLGKKLRGKSPARIFWYLAEAENLGDIGHAVQ